MFLHTDKFFRDDSPVTYLKQPFISGYRTVSVWASDSVNLRTFMIGNKVNLLRELSLSHKTQLLNSLSVTKQHRVVYPV